MKNGAAPGHHGRHEHVRLARQRAPNDRPGWHELFADDTTANPQVNMRFVPIRVTWPGVVPIHLRPSRPGR
jgi:hypothetical protein